MIQLSTLILAAGRSHRFNGNKLLTRLPDGQLMVLRIIAQCAAVTENIMVVTGAHHKQLSRHLPDNVNIIYNPDWHEGMSGSIATGVQQIHQCYPTTTHILIMLGDLPAVTAPSLEVLKEVAELEPEKMVASYWDGKCTAPAIFPGQYWPHLRQLQGDNGAGRLLNNGLYQQPPQTFPVPHPEAALDIDTTEALKKLAQRL